MALFEKKTNLLDGRPKTFLHIAPEPGIERRLRRILNLDYVTGDLDRSAAAVRVDVTDIPFRDNWFDVVYCSHVVEHVSDDRKAMRELYRVLKPRGWAMIPAPIIAARTLEDATATTPQLRLRMFGQADHVRAYGPDYLDRLREAGFTVHEIDFRSEFSEGDIERFGIQPENQIRANSLIHLLGKEAR